MMVATSEGDVENVFICGILTENELNNDSTTTQTEDLDTKNNTMALCNETYSFKIDSGNYFANFAYTPSQKLDSQLLFKGILNGSGHYVSHKCIIRTNTEGTEESWQRYCEVRKMLKAIKQIFQANNCALTFYIPKSALAIMEREALPSKLASAFRGWRRPKTDEWVLVDLYRNCHAETTCTGPLFSAISHISLNLNNGQRYLTNFQAFKYNRNKICITSADISTDIAAFERTHRCREMCALEMPFNQFDSSDTEKNGIDAPISHPMSAPVIGDNYFWSREPIAPPPYTPTAPPIHLASPPAYCTLATPPQRQFSV